MTFVKSGWKTTAALMAAVGVLMFAGGASAGVLTLAEVRDSTGVDSIFPGSVNGKSNSHFLSIRTQTEKATKNRTLTLRDSAVGYTRYDSVKVFLKNYFKGDSLANVRVSLSNNSDFSFGTYQGQRADSLGVIGATATDSIWVKVRDAKTSPKTYTGSLFFRVHMDREFSATDSVNVGAKSTTGYPVDTLNLSFRLWHMYGLGHRPGVISRRDTSVEYSGARVNLAKPVYKDTVGISKDSVIYRWYRETSETNKSLIISPDTTINEWISAYSAPDNTARGWARNAGTYWVYAGYYGPSMKPITWPSAEDNTDRRTTTYQGGASTELILGYDSVKVEIRQRPLSSEKIGVSLASSVQYTGLPIKPDVVVWDTANPVEKRLVLGSDYQSDVPGVSDGINDSIYQDNIKAGTAFVKIKGKGNYSGFVSKAFTITPAPLSVVGNDAKIGGRVYDGTDTLPGDAIVPKWIGLLASDSLVKGSYTISNVKLSGKNAGNVTLTADVDIPENHVIAGNYRLTSTGKRISVTSANIILPDSLRITHLDSIPVASKTYYYTGRGVDIKPLIRFKTQYAGQPAGSGFDVKYGGNDSVGVVFAKTELPKGFLTKDSVYAVFVKAVGNVNFNATKFRTPGVDGGSVEAATSYLYVDSIKINRPDSLRITTNFSSDITVRKNAPVKIAVGVTSREGTSSKQFNSKKLGYQWFRLVPRIAPATGYDSSLVSGENGGKDSLLNFSTLSDAIKTGDSLLFALRIDQNPDGLRQIPDTVWSNLAKVRIGEPAKNIADAVISVRLEDSLFYDGTKKTNIPYVVYLKPAAGSTDTVFLSKGSDFTDTIYQNVDAGDGLIELTGVNNYYSKKSATFPIYPKVLSLEDLSWPTSAEYNGKAQPLIVSLKPGFTKLGATTITYDNAATPPTDVKEVAVKMTVSNAGKVNFKANTTPYDLGVYEITKRTPDLKDLSFEKFNDFPRDWPDTVFLNDTVSSSKTNAKKGVGKVTLPGSGYGASKDTVQITYTDNDTIPNKKGVYAVVAVIEGGKNYYPARIPIGTWIVEESKTNVKKGDRDIKNKIVVSEAAVAPIKAAGSVFTAGPNPVSKAAGVLKFFSSKSVKSGSLYIFDASGNAVAKVAAKAGSGEIGSWNLKDKKGVAVAEGTYVVKGALTAKDGTREKVSFLFSVVK